MFCCTGGCSGGFAAAGGAVGVAADADGGGNVIAIILVFAFIGNVNSCVFTTSEILNLS